MYVHMGKHPSGFHLYVLIHFQYFDVINHNQILYIAMEIHILTEGCIHVLITVYNSFNSLSLEIVLQCITEITTLQV
jgi:hypothetical protein